MGVVIQSACLKNVVGVRKLAISIFTEKVICRYHNNASLVSWEIY